MILEDRIRNWIEAYERNHYLHGAIMVAAGENILINQGFGWQIGNTGRVLSTSIMLGKNIRHVKKRYFEEF